VLGGSREGLRRVSVVLPCAPPPSGGRGPAAPAKIFRKLRQPARRVLLLRRLRALLDNRLVHELTDQRAVIALRRSRHHLRLRALPGTTGSNHGPAITEIDSHHFRGRGGLNREAHLILSVSPPIDVNAWEFAGNRGGNTVGMWENGPSFPEVGTESSSLRMGREGQSPFGSNPC